MIVQLNSEQMKITFYKVKVVDGKGVPEIAYKTIVPKQQYVTLI